MKILSILGWILQAVICIYCIFAIVAGAINLAIVLMFCLYVFAFIQERIEFYFMCRTQQ